MAHHLPSIPELLYVHYWICLVRALSREKVLYETVQLVCLDSCGSLDCCHPVIPHHSEYFPGNDLVSDETVELLI